MCATFTTPLLHRVTTFISVASPDFLKKNLNAPFFLLSATCLLSIPQSVGDFFHFFIFLPARDHSPPSFYLAQRRRNGAPLPTAECSTRYWLDSSARAKSDLALNIHDPSFREELLVIVVSSRWLTRQIQSFANE